MKYILAPLVIIAGILMMRYTVQVTNFTGKVGFAEEYFGKGLAAGTYTWWRLVGLFFVVVGALWLFGMLDLLGDLLKTLLGVSK